MKKSFFKRVLFPLYVAVFSFICLGKAIAVDRLGPRGIKKDKAKSRKIPEVRALFFL